MHPPAVLGERVIGPQPLDVHEVGAARAVGELVEVVNDEMLGT
jgi:hypothetical protein